MIGNCYDVVPVLSGPSTYSIRFDSISSYQVRGLCTVILSTTTLAVDLLWYNNNHQSSL